MKRGSGEMAVLGEVPFRCYYGSVDSTPLFVLLAGAYFERTGDLAVHPGAVAEYRGGARAGSRPTAIAMATVLSNMAAKAGGAGQPGLEGQSRFVFHADGSLARGPIALCEVQAYVYGAWRAAALLARALGLKRKRWTGRARRRLLRQRFDEVFFDDELGCYVLALDGEKKPCRVRASNAGHALFTGIATQGTRRRRGRRADGPHIFLRLGRADPGLDGGPLQSDELSQRLDLAA